MTAALLRIQGAAVVIDNPRVKVMSPVEVYAFAALASTSVHIPSLAGTMDGREGRMITPCNLNKRPE